MFKAFLQFISLSSRWLHVPNVLLLISLQKILAKFGNVDSASIFFFFFFQTMRLVTDSEITKRHIPYPANHLRLNLNKRRLWHLVYDIYVVWMVIVVRSKRFKPLATPSLIYIGTNTKSCRRVSRTPANI